MEVKQVRKKPVVVEAFRWTGDDPYGVMSHINASSDTPERQVASVVNGNLHISTLESSDPLVATPGYWIIKGVAGEFYPCRPDIFEQTYEIVE